MKNFNFLHEEISRLEFYLPENFKGLSKKYISNCIFDEEIQSNWNPEIGDIIVGKFGNIYIISGVHGDICFFGGFLSCSEDDGRLDTPSCYSVNKNSLKSSTDYKFVPWPHELVHYKKDKFFKEVIKEIEKVSNLNIQRIWNIVTTISPKQTINISKIEIKDEKIEIEYFPKRFISRLEIPIKIKRSSETLNDEGNEK